MTDPQEPNSEIQTRFTRSEFCRVIHVDGVWGGFTPQWNVHMALYSERWALPDGTTIRFDAEGVREDAPVSAGPIREIEADVILSQTAAIALRDWLITRLSSLQGAPQPDAQVDSQAGE